MLARFRDWLFGGGEMAQLPDRVREAITRQQEQSEILIGWVQLVIVVLVTTVYQSTTMPGGVVQEDYSFEVDVLVIYGIFCLVRLALAYARLLRPWMLYLSVVADIFLLMGLIYSFHYKYAQPAVFYLKVPTLLYVFLFIALRALRFEARFVLFTGLTAIAGWICLILYAVGGRGGPANPTDDFVEYMTSNALLVHAEVDKIIAILLTTLVLALAISRARHLLVQAVSEGAAAQDLSRFFDPGVAARIRGAEMSIRAGEGELRDVSILTVDLRGFTRLATELQPDEVMKVLQDYQHRVCPLIVAAGGSIDKFLGDGILASFGAVKPSVTAAADALRAAEAVMAAAAAWAAERRAAGLPPLDIGLAASSGRVVFGAVGDGERLEFTVIGDAVNFAAKLEKHNKVEGTRALTDGATYALAERQGYRPAAPHERRPGRQVAGVTESVDIVVLSA
ncbi:adenylate/guanylate cyclase domain-containing protein [Reyranella aquatilis]|uniref:Adenylate/guanylate cyclase domain-containing protein n=1 Tax=Reyranella aquatilis TaxID=2035356 RepID=A0ABS8KST5_9HYPH|nr:adenylate/guanylate cyclase domain-containing protein [Reyranella aquatilis]MCC8429118.1 adenylate/guanylate cyclase domain-containing protein [Reyranella aquatilis]